MSFPIWYKEAEKMYIEGIPYYKIGEELEVSRKTVSHWLRKGGHSSNPKYVRSNITNQKHSQDETVFEKIQTEAQAYWLGFLYADGYVSDSKNSIEVSLAEKDKEHLWKLKEFFKTTQEIKEKHKKTPTKIYKGCRLIVNSPKIKQDLIDLGCVTKKSLVLKFPTYTEVPKKLMHHFVRGYFDGDGCITHTSNKNKGLAVEILGTSEFIDSLIKWTDLEVRKHSFNHAKETFRVQMFSVKGLSFLERIYKDSTIYLERKYQKFNQFAPCNGDIMSGVGEIGEA